MPECITKLCWDVKVKSMQEAELLKVYVSFVIIRLKLNWEVTISILDPSEFII